MSAPWPEGVTGVDRAVAIARLDAASSDGSTWRDLSLDGTVVRAALGALGIALALGAWELAVDTGVLPEVDVPRASSVIGELWRLLGTGRFWTVIGETASGAASGLAIAMAVGIALGVALGASEVARRATGPTVEFLRPVPGIALVPVAAVIWGPARGSDVFLVAFGCVWPLLTQTMHGVRNVDDVALTTARSLRLGPLSRVRWIYVPGSLPYILTGLRIAVPIALIASIGAEIIIGSPGIGTEIRRAQTSLDLPRMYALVIAAGMLGLAATLVTGALERRSLRWHQSQRGGTR